MLICNRDFNLTIFMKLMIITGTFWNYSHIVLNNFNSALSGNVSGGIFAIAKQNCNSCSLQVLCINIHDNLIENLCFFQKGKIKNCDSQLIISNSGNAIYQPSRILMRIINNFTWKWNEWKSNKQRGESGSKQSDKRGNINSSSRPSAHRHSCVNSAHVVTVATSF